MLKYKTHGTTSSPPPPQSGAVLTTFTLTSPNTGLAEFSLAVPVKKAVTGGPSISTSITNSQCTIKRTWNDSSVKHVLIDGIANLTANTPLTVQVIDNPGVGGPNMTSANIATALATAGQNVVNLGVNGSVDLSTLLASPTRTWKTGPFAVECHYQKSIAGIVVFFHVRLYSTGKARIFCSVDNGYVDIANSNKSYTATVTIGGTVIFGPTALTHYANTRWLAEGWVGANPSVTPKHTITDLIATKLVSNYILNAPSAAALNGLSQSYAPYSAGDWTLDQSGTGAQHQIGLLTRWDALYITSQGDSRAFNSVVANAKAANNYAITWRGSTDSNLPCRPSIFPTYTVNGAGGGGSNGTTAGSMVWDAAHHGSAGYLAYLLTGDYIHLETMQLQAATYYLVVSSAAGSGTSRSFTVNPADGSTFKGGQAVRGPAWGTRTWGQLASIAPSTDAMLSDAQGLLTTQASINLGVSQLAGVNQLGILYEFDLYNDAHGAGIISMFMHWFWPQVWGLISDCEPISSMTNWNTVRDWLYKIPVGMAGDNSGGTTYYYTFVGETFDFHLASAHVASITDANWYGNWGNVFTNTIVDPASFTASISGTTLTVSAITGNGKIESNQTVVGTGVTAATTIGSQLTGSGGGVGTFSVNNSQTVASESMTTTRGSATGNTLQGDGLGTGGVLLGDAEGYWANYLPAISYAVDHAATGAQAGFNRISAATNFLTLYNGVGGDTPNWAITPRNFTADVTASALSTLANSTWSSDIVITGNHTNDAIPGISNSEYQYTGDTFNWGISSAPTTAKFTFSSGCYMGGSKKYALPGSGGHSDWPGNEIVIFDHTTGKWTLTEHTCRYVSTGIADASNPTSNGETTFKPYPNVAGRRSQGPLHTYSAAVWCPDFSLGFVQGGGSYNSGLGVFGSYLWDANGQWSQTHHFAGNAGTGTSVCPRGINLSTLWLGGAIQRIYAQIWPDSNHAALFDPIGGTTTTTGRYDLNSTYPDLHDANSPGCLIPDPNNAGDTAYVFWKSGAGGVGDPAATDAIFYMPKVGSGTAGQASSTIAFGGSVPSAISAATKGANRLTSWFDFAGNYKSGSTKILVWDWNGTGIYLLDTGTWTFTGPLTGSAMPFTNPNTSAGGKLIYVPTDYVSSGNYIPVALIASDTGRCFLYRIPWSAV